MNEIKIDRQMIHDRIKLIEKYLVRLQEFRGISEGKFALPDNFAIASYNLRSALEATFDISAHILVRIPGAPVDEYKKMAIEMGKQGIVPMEFAKKKLEKMAGYRNRLTHFYFEVTPEEMYGIIQHDLGDFEMFMRYIKTFMEK